MQSSKTTAILLTFLMLLIVLGSAVVFLVNRNRELDQLAEMAASERDAVVVTRTHLESDLVVLDSAYEAAGATRDASVRQNISIEATLEAYLAISAESELSGSDAAPSDESPKDESSSDSSLVVMVEDEPEPKTQLFMFSSSDGDVVHPLETITLYMAAFSEDGVDRIELVIDDGETVIYPAGGLITFTLPVRWEVNSEGTHIIKATAYGVGDQANHSGTITVEAAYESEEDKALAIRDQQLSALGSVRFPASVIESTPDLSRSVNEDVLHFKMLTGWNSFEEVNVYSKTLTLQTFDFLPPGYDLDDYLHAVEGIFVARNGPDSVRVFSADEVANDGPLTRWLTAHEVAHEFQNDSFQLDSLEFNMIDSDARMALRALIEGEVAFLQNLYLNSDSFNSGEREIIEQSLESSQPSSLDTFPMFLRKEFEFAYTAGSDFIRYLYDQGGLEALDNAWRRPPVSTEQILHPERYLSEDVPEQTALQALEPVLLDGWFKVDEDTLGEFALREYLAQTLTREEAEAAASGWGGGNYALYADEQSDFTILLLTMSWDTLADQQEFEDAYRKFMDVRSGVEGVERASGYCWEQDEVFCLVQHQEKNYIIHSPVASTAESIISSIIVP